MQSLELLENRELRNKNLNKIEVLKKVGNLLLLPNKDFATTKQVAEFFEVNLETIQKLIQRNKEELENNGLFLLKRKEIKELKKTTKELKHIPETWTFKAKTIIKLAFLLTN